MENWIAENKSGPTLDNFNYKDLPIIKASKDFEEKLERKIQKYESEISKGKRKSPTKSSKR